MRALRYGTILLVALLCCREARAQPAPRHRRRTEAEQWQERRERWRLLGPEERRELMQRYERWKRLPPDERKELRERLGRLKALPDVERQALRRRLQAWSRLNPEERRRMERRLAYWRQLPPKQKERVARALWILKRLLPEEFDAFKHSVGTERKQRRRALARRLADLLKQPRERLRPLSELPPDERRQALRNLLRQGPGPTSAPPPRPRREGTPP